MRLLLISLLFLFSCQKSQTPSSRETLRTSLTSDPRSLDPRKGRDLIESALSRMLFEGLATLSSSGKAELALAERVDVSEDLMTYTFHLRKSYWSNGDVVTSLDFAKSWKTILDPHFPTDIAGQLFCLRNGKKAKTGEVGLDQVGVETPDAFTLVVHLEQPTPYFLDLVSLPAFFPVCTKAVDADPHWASTPATFVCNGPFRLAAWQPSHLLRLTKNDRYSQAANIKVAGLDFYVVDEDTGLRMFELGELDWTGSPLAAISPDALHELREGGFLRTESFCATSFFRVNTAEQFEGKKNPLASAAFRKALSLALNREEITQHVLQGGQMAARSFVPPSMGLLEAGYFQDNDLEKARSYLTNALSELHLTLEAIPPLQLVYRPSQVNARLAQTVQRQWQEHLGLRIILEAPESKVFHQRISGLSYQLALGSWSADFNDPINFLEIFKEKENALNNTGWEDPEYIRLLNGSALCRDLKEREALLRSAEHILMDQMPIIPLYHNAMNYLQSNKLENVVLSPMGYVDFKAARINAGESL